MSRLSNRVSSIVAALAIIFLVVFLVILWTSINTADTSYPGKSQVTNFTGLPRKFNDNGPLRIHQEITDQDSIDNYPDNNLPDLDVKGDRENLSWKEDILPKTNTNGDIEYVIPMKLSYNQYEDPPTEATNARRHHSGHFRHFNTQIWDPHPQYEFTAFGEKFLLKLKHDNSFISQNIKVTHTSQNRTKWEHPGHQLGCYYTGVVDGDPKSIVSVSLCHGMTGHMKTSSGSYIIKPTTNRIEDKDTANKFSFEHAIYRVSATRTNSNNVDLPDESGHNCGVIDYGTAEDASTPLADETNGKIQVGDHRRERRSLSEKNYIDYYPISDNKEERYRRLDEFIRHQREYSSRNQLYDDRSKKNIEEEDLDEDDEEEMMTDSNKESLDINAAWRSRRALPKEYFIEIMVVADAKMIELHGVGLVSYILGLMNTVSRIFKDPSIGNPISLSITKIVKIEEVFGTRQNGTDGIAAAEMLKKFCYWQKHNNPDEPSPEHHDVALLLTREDLCHNIGQRRCDTLGLAELGRMCSPGSSCAIAQDNGLAAAFTIAHEIGHVFNMPHDDDNRCVKFRNRSPIHKVMSRMLDDKTHPWEWSKCSRHYLTEFLESGKANCLLDEPRDMIRSDSGRLPGEDYSENEQCELVFGLGSKICPHIEIDVCKRLWCTAPSSSHQPQCHTQHMPWADGTPCAFGMWCQRGRCVSKRNLIPIDGQWGEWGRYGPCSRSCGGGIKAKRRECNNPPPQNSGNYCIGEHVKYHSCGTKECPPGSPDFREEQCAMWNNHHNVQNLSRDVKWHAKSIKIPQEDRCKLFCQVESNQYYMLNDTVIDGTPCGPDTFDICVNGHCKQAGCDHVLGSNAKLDTCGVCRGDNSTCQRITGAYNSSGVYGYRKVTKIPKGSSYIDIRQLGWGGSHNDSNYLVLRLGEDGEYILNGNYMVMHKKVIVLPGSAIEYSGPGTVVERLNSSRPVGVDLILEILSVGDIVPPQITYEYTVPKRILGSYTWILSDWSSCSHMCQGNKQRRAECRNTEHKDVVSDDYCRREERPQEESQLCNTHCILQWQLTPKSECSKHCGPGTQMVSSRCFQVILNSPNQSARLLRDYACAHLERPSDIRPCVGPCDDVRWSYSDWGTCSVTCGGGVQIRTAKCIDSNGVEVAENTCNASEKILKRFCGSEACPQWTFGEWSPCSTTCGIGKRLRSYWCQVENRIVNQVYCNKLLSAVSEICNAGPCHHWSTGEWSSCSVTCGEGTRRRKVACMNADGTSSDSCAPSEEPESFQTCSREPCPTITTSPIYSSEPTTPDSFDQENEIDSNRIPVYPIYVWRTGTFGACSRSCNGGFKNRIVQCSSPDTHTSAPDDYCDINLRPASRMPCNRHACPLWNTGHWSQCDADCGEGYQHRQVRCQSPRGEILPDRECTTVDKPKHVKKCWNDLDCVTNNQHNHNTNTNNNHNHSHNHNHNNNNNNNNYDNNSNSKGQSRRWRVSNWTPCSADCGDGIQRRAVTCHHINRYGWIDPSPAEGCPLDKKPKSEQHCKLQRCDDKYYWTAGPWRKCSHPCGRKGRQIRRLFCHDRTGTRVARSNCPAEFKPQRKRKCNQRRCGPLTCLEAQRRLKSTKDGEYTLLIGGKNMSIYCHDMGTSEPREYLTLPAGDRENYAEIYDKRLNDPNTCPFGGQRNDSCDCFDNRGTVSGRTMFKRVRIDVAKLIIMANDYTFSWTKGAKRVEYGKAGDCYSRQDCPQGRFSINLTGTALKLAREVTWKPEKSRAHLAINRITDQRILGKCGGYCGFCSPAGDMKLEVHPS
ncbi:A disintegrin and metalloproteinase with thrombospondin motifs 9 isoform X2 [Cotesia glomerata]|uniref:A disintegrin and metalloproteinase with thrombospondin motifs 9 isoform X2 n=1 Tax=Cotesia glomerata TaxID=32391 RepID=UPI001D01654D|nr:A disintegrin and metalloproteinase with thrombospondin motifs 9 isoform X2 [Cotesia glomerata]